MSVVLSCPAQVRLEPVHPGVPPATPSEQPVDRLVQGVDLQPARRPLRLARAHDQARPLQGLEMLRDRRQGHRERLGQLAPQRTASTRSVLDIYSYVCSNI